MAELVVTEEERHTLKFLEWDDEALGKATKVVATILNDKDGDQALKATGAAVFLIDTGIESNATEIVVSLEGAYNGDRNLGNWRVTLERIDEIPQTSSSD